MSPNPALEILKKGLAALKNQLETGSDYQRGLACLNSKEKILVEQLKALGGDSEGAAPAVSNKRKRPVERKQPQKKAEKGPAIPIFTKKENTTVEIEARLAI
ncbi:hypothetical protein B0H14DRAFT_2559650 [Mycena olivaceomarginata]|nr:hypothetical protein B0H14DRAFT_2559650 [Mycena olivaceomarginata]